MAGLRKLVTAFAGVPGIIGLHGGLPPASAFPITEMTFTLRDGQKVVVDDPAKVCTQHPTSGFYCSAPSLVKMQIHCTTSTRLISNFTEL